MWLKSGSKGRALREREEFLKLHKTLASKANIIISNFLSLEARAEEREFVIWNQRYPLKQETPSSADIGLDGSFTGVEERPWLCVSIAAEKNCSGTQESFRDGLNGKKKSNF